MGRRFLAGPAFEVADMDGCGKVPGEAVKANPQRLKEVVFIVGFPCLPGGNVGIDLSNLFVGEEVTFVSADPLSPLVSDDPAHPCCKIPGHVKGRDLVVGEDEGLLDNVTRRRLIASQGPGIDKKFTMVPLHQFGEVFIVAGIEVDHIRRGADAGNLHSSGGIDEFLSRCDFELLKFACWSGGQVEEGQVAMRSLEEGPLEEGQGCEEGQVAM